MLLDLDLLNSEIVALMKSVASEIDGNYIQNKKMRQFGVIKDNTVILYRFPDRYTTAGFSVIHSLPILMECDITIRKAPIIEISKSFYNDDLFNVVIGDKKNKYNLALAESLIDDAQFMSNFKALFNTKFNIHISNQSIAVTWYEVATSYPFEISKQKEELIKMWKITNELKTSIDYFAKKYNPIL